MIVTRLLRWTAYAIAVAAVVDPAIRLSRPAPLPVAFRTADGRLVPGAKGSSVSRDADAVRAGLEAGLPGLLAINTNDNPAALIVVGSTLDSSSIPESGPVSFVTPEATSGPRVHVASVTDPRPVLPGWAAVVTAEVSGHGVVPGESSTIVLESHGVEVDRVAHEWTRGDEHFTARLSFAPPAAGSFSLTVRALPAAGKVESMAALPVRIVADTRRLKIMAFDPRPSWNSGFARRALEENPDFEVVTRVRASRGLEVRTGAAPMVLTGAAMDPFDLVLVGAPEELTSAEVGALEAFARRRGGTVVLIADRKPSGPYLRLLGTAAFDEALLEKPLRVTASDGSSIRASEIAFPRALPPGAEPILTIPQGAGSRAPMVSVPLGAGRVVFAGLLDAWRYRGDDDDAYASFWRSQLGSEAARAPRRLEVTMEPGVAGAGSRVRLRAAVRGTDLTVAPGVLTVPGIAARIVDERGRQEAVRMWPAAEPGMFEGWLEAARPGRYDVRVESDGGASADALLIVRDADPREDVVSTDRAAAIAGATGGTSVARGDLRPLVDQLRALPRGTVVEARHPMRSPWWAGAFIGLLSIEWATRRRRGLR